MGPFIRIALRYLAGALVAYGLVPADIATDLANDPDVFGVAMHAVDWGVVALGSAIGAATEWIYAEAKKRGWAT